MRLLTSLSLRRSRQRDAVSRQIQSLYKHSVTVLFVATKSGKRLSAQRCAFPVRFWIFFTDCLRAPNYCSVIRAILAQSPATAA